MSGGSEESASKMTEDVSGWKVESVNIRSAENGGFIVSCSKTRQSSGENMGSAPVAPGGRDYESKDYAFGSLNEVQQYLAQEFGGGTPAEMPMADLPADEMEY